jgi:hypothetical protein
MRIGRILFPNAYKVTRIDTFLRVKPREQSARILPRIPKLLLGLVWDAPVSTADSIGWRRGQARQKMPVNPKRHTVAIQLKLNKDLLRYFVADIPN